MCGCVGFLALHDGAAPTTAWIETLIDTIVHRGPDDHGIFIDGPRRSAFAGCRSSICLRRDTSR